MDNDAKMLLKVGISIVFGIVFLILLWGSFFQVSAGQRGVLLTWGAAEKVAYNPGLHLKWPIAQGIIKMNVQVQKAQEAETASSLDLQNVTTTVATNWHIDPVDASWVYQNIGNEKALTDKIIAPAVSNSVKAVVAHYNAEELIEKRDAVKSQIEQQIKSALSEYKVIVDSVNITNFAFSLQYSQAIEKKQVSQQRAQQAQYQLQRAQIVAQQTVVQAKAQAQAQQLLQQTITPEIIQLKAVEKWNGVLPKVTGNGALPLIGNITQ